MNRASAQNKKTKKTQRGETPQKSPDFVFSFFSNLRDQSHPHDGLVLGRHARHVPAQKRAEKDGQHAHDDNDGRERHGGGHDVELDVAPGEREERDENVGRDGREKVQQLAAVAALTEAGG